MGVYIKGMEMPKTCNNCPIEYDGIWCSLQEHAHTIDIIKDEKEPDCPLVEIPDKYGDLIDKDAIIAEIMDSDLDHLQRDDWEEVIQIVADAPTVTPAQQEIIHCKDCANWIEDYYCKTVHHPTLEHDTCETAFGARRKGEGLYLREDGKLGVMDNGKVCEEGKR